MFERNNGIVIAGQNRVGRSRPSRDLDSLPSALDLDVMAAASQETGGEVQKPGILASGVSVLRAT